jgi:hypothetical protein
MARIGHQAEAATYSFVQFRTRAGVFPNAEVEQAADLVAGAPSTDRASIRRALATARAAIRSSPQSGLVPSVVSR